MVGLYWGGLRFYIGLRVLNSNLEVYILYKNYYNLVYIILGIYILY